MRCSDFLARFSEYYDQDPELEDRASFESHMESCRSCRRYSEVVARGGELLRGLPLPELRHDFFPRLQHRVFHLDQEEAIRRSTSGSAMTAGTAVAVAAILVVVAWYPAFLDDTVEVDLPAIVVEEPASPEGSRLSASPPSEPVLTRSSTFNEPSLWAQSNVLLYEHSSLGRRHRDPGVIHAGLP